MTGYSKVTREYYTRWLDCDARAFDGGVTYVCSPKRDVALYGHSFPMSLSLFQTPNAVVVSYSGRFQEQINQMKQGHSTAKSFETGLGDYLDGLFPGEKVERSIKFVFEREIPHQGENVVPLSRGDFALFLNFRLSLGQSQWDGMQSYFEEISGKGYCIAKMADGKAVSMTDAPGMAFIPDLVQEIGINTLPDYRRRGCAREVVSACVSKIISDNRCPMWSCDADNIASERLAYSVGFRKFCDGYNIDVR